MMQFYKCGLVVCMALAGCSDQSEQTSPSAQESARPTSSEPQGNSATSPPPPTVLVPPKAGKVHHKDAALDFRYEWPMQAAAIGALDAWLSGNAASRYAQAHKAAMQDSEAMKAGGFPFRQHELEQGWATVANTPQVLVLQAEGYAYTGGAHGMPFTSAIIWDKAREQRVGIGQFFDLPRFARLVSAEFCDLLNTQRREKRGIVVKPDATDPFSGCPDVLKQEIVPVSRRGKGLDTVRIIIGPYEAGPYAEGSYAIEMQADGEMMRTVRRPYNTWFATP